MNRIRVAALGVLVAGLLLPAATASAAPASVVHAGQSIQAAINAAPAGGWVVVERGTYRENLTITKSVRIVGRGAILRPPSTATANICSQFESGAASGICVTGTLDQQGGVTSPLGNVRIEGLTITDFKSMGVFAVGVSNFAAIGNTFANNGDYGIFANQASKVTFIGNVARNNGAPGLYIGDSPNANATVVGNQSYGNNGEGLLFRDSLGGRVSGNSIHGNCAGIFVLDTGAPGAAGNVSLALNDVWGNNRLCPGEPGEAPPMGGIGIGLLGAQHTTVFLNMIRNNVSQPGSGISGGGLVLLDTTSFGGGAPHDNSAHHNRLSGNAPQDVNGDGTGTGNAISGNDCTTTNVSGAC